MRFLNGELTFFINGSPLAVSLSAATIAGATFPNDKALAPIVGIHNGTGAVSSITLDWWKCYQLRA